MEQEPSRWIIDFGMMSIGEARGFPGAFSYVQTHVYPIRKNNRREAYAKKWWRFVEPRPTMRESLRGVERFLAISYVTPHIGFTFGGGSIVVDHTAIALSLGSEFSFGVLQSAVHNAWAWSRGSTFESRLRYTPTTIFETFPFPPLPDGGYDPRVVPDTEEARMVTQVAEELYRKRSELCRERILGLTKIYNLMRDGAATELQELHDRLSDAVCACYGWPAETWRDRNEVLARLLELNQRLTGAG